MADFIPLAPNGNSPFADMRGHHAAIRTPDGSLQALASGAYFRGGRGRIR